MMIPYSGLPQKNATVCQHWHFDVCLLSLELTETHDWYRPRPEGQRWFPDVLFRRPFCWQGTGKGMGRLLMVHYLSFSIHCCSKPVMLWYIILVMVVALSTLHFHILGLLPKQLRTIGSAWMHIPFDDTVLYFGPASCAKGPIKLPCQLGAERRAELRIWGETWSKIRQTLVQKLQLLTLLKLSETQFY